MNTVVIAIEFSDHTTNFAANNESNSDEKDCIIQKKHELIARQIRAFVLLFVWHLAVMFWLVDSLDWCH